MGTLELEIHTYQKDSFKKVVDFCDGNVDDFFSGNSVAFFGGNIVDFFGENIVDFFGGNIVDFLGRNIIDFFGGNIVDFFRRKYRWFFRQKNWKVKKFLQCLQCQLPLCSETYQQHRTPPKQQILVWKWQPCTALWQHNLFGLLCLAWLGKASRARQLLQSVWACAVVVLVALSTPCACASAVESLLFSAASWQFGEHLWKISTILWIFRGHSWKFLYRKQL